MTVADYRWSAADSVGTGAGYRGEPDPANDWRASTFNAPCYYPAE